MLSTCMEIQDVPEDWKVVCIVSVYKLRGERNEWGNYEGIRILRIPGMLYDKVLVSRLAELKRVAEQQGGLKRRSSWM